MGVSVVRHKVFTVSPLCYERFATIESFFYFRTEHGRFVS